ncbi:MAG: ATP-grasp domain-containing protein [Giesbergeria sp.]|nr:ATP-grasp domain-containing protein [Giesbergeria sp.]
MKARNVLVFPAGTEIGLEIHQALQQCKEVVLHGAGQPISNHAPFVYQRYHSLPSINEPGWLEALVDLCRDLAIDYIFPAYDDVIVALALHRTEIPATVLTASDEVCELTRSKSQTYGRLGATVRVPRLYSPKDAKTFPLFVKPDRGQGSQGAQLVRDAVELAVATGEIRDPIVCEYLPGEEYTVDCFSDREQGVLFCGARVRLRMRNGIAVHTLSVDLDGVQAIAVRIHESLGMRGAWFFQLKRAADGELALLEVAPRIAGSMSTHRVQGVNFPLLTIFEHERLALKLLTLPMRVELDRALHNRYRLDIQYEALYIDLDDTLLLGDMVNIAALQLVFMCVNRKIPVTLITRHDGNLDRTLRKHRLTGLFDEIIHLDRSQRKSEFIRQKNAIFLDDSFSERLDVHERCGIPTFDCSMLEALISNHPSDMTRNKT